MKTYNGTGAAEAKPASAYAIPRVASRVDLRLDGNEGRVDRARLVATRAEAERETARRYPDPAAFEAFLAAREEEPVERVLATAGADDALLRLCLATLGDGSDGSERSELVLPTPTFEMLSRYADVAGGRIVEVPWTEPRYPIDAVLAAVTERTSLIAVVSPNNPTGGVAQAEDLVRIAEAAPQATVLLDLAYDEFDDLRELAQAARALPNVVRVRTLSKAWGLAGLRVGWAVGSAERIEAMRARGNPYPIAGPSLALARARLERDADEVAAFVERVREERTRLRDLLLELGARCDPSQANFVLARVDDAAAAQLALAERGIAVRRFAGRAGLEDALRITCPGDERAMQRLCLALREALAPSSSASGDLCLEPVRTLEPRSSVLGDGAARTAEVLRETAETRVRVRLTLDGDGNSDVRTGIGFLDHMLTAFARHARLDLELSCVGDMEVDDHHTAEDCALALGEALDRALGERRGIARFGSAYAPLDEALARAVVDLSGRPWPSVALDLQRERLGELACENVPHVLNSLAIAARCTLNVRVLEGQNDHHKTEAAFKATALAFRTALARDGSERVPSTKEVL